MNQAIPSTTTNPLITPDLHKFFTDIGCIPNPWRCLGDYFHEALGEMFSYTDQLTSEIFSCEDDCKAPTVIVGKKITPKVRRQYEYHGGTFLEIGGLPHYIIHRLFFDSGREKTISQDGTTSHSDFLAGDCYDALTGQFITPETNYSCDVPRFFSSLGCNLINDGKIAYFFESDILFLYTADIDRTMQMINKPAREDLNAYLHIVVDDDIATQVIAQYSNQFSPILKLGQVAENLAKYCFSEENLPYRIGIAEERKPIFMRLIEEAKLKQVKSALKYSTSDY